MYIFLLVAAFAVIAAAIVLTAFFLIVAFSLYFWSDRKGAPYVRSKSEKIRTMLGLAEIKPGETALDLGSGDGTIVIEAAKRGAKAVGVEINPFLVWHSRRKIARENLKESCHIARCDFRAYPLNGADAIFLYLWPSTLEKLKEKLEREIKPGCRVVSNSYPIPGWTPVAERGGVYLYQKKD